MSDKDYLHDLRVVNRYISEGKVSEKDHEKFIKNLDDVSEKSEALVIEEDVEDEEANAEETDE